MNLRLLLLGSLLLSLWLPHQSHALPIQTTILGPSQEPVGRANIYIDYVELLDPEGNQKGRIGFTNAQGQFQMLVVREGEARDWVGTAANRRLYDRSGKLLAFYDWTTFWIYVYAPDGTRLGQAKCIAFRGVCAAGIAGYLSGILEPDYAPPPPPPDAAAAAPGPDSTVQDIAPTNF